LLNINDLKIYKFLLYFVYTSIFLAPFLPVISLLGVDLFVVFLLFKRRYVSFKSPELFFLGFALICVLSFLKTPSYIFNIPILIFPLFFFLSYYFLTIFIRFFNSSYEDIKKVYVYFWLSGIYVFLIVILQYKNNLKFLAPLLNFYNSFRFQAEHSIRSIGTTGNSNITAAMLICFALTSIYFSFIFKGLKRLIPLFTFLLFCYAIAYTGSRGACVGLIFGLIVQLWFTGHRFKTFVLCLSLLLLFILYPEIIPRNDTLLSTLNVRISVWKTSLFIFLQNFLFGTLPIHFGQLFYKQTGNYLVHAHNIFLSIAVEYGIFGFCLFLCLIFLTLYRGYKLCVLSKECKKHFVGMLLSQLIAILSHGMYDYPIIHPQVGLLFVLNIILINVLYQAEITNVS